MFRLSINQDLDVHTVQNLFETKDQDSALFVIFKIFFEVQLLEAKLHDKKYQGLLLHIIIILPIMKTFGIEKHQDNKVRKI